VWLNPPYSQPLIGQFVGKLLVELESGRVTDAIVLTNNGTETAWGQALLRASRAVCFPKGRVRFLTPAGEPGAPLQGQMVTYLSFSTEGVASFAKHFSRFGPIVNV
jgi:hypothetical protein